MRKSPAPPSSLRRSVASSILLRLRRPPARRPTPVPRSPFPVPWILRPRRRGYVNLKVLLITAAAAVLLLAGAFAAHRVRKHWMIGASLDRGLAAFEQGHWDVAVDQLGRYLYHHQDDTDTLRKFARAELARRPLKPEHIVQAAAALRKVLLAHPDDDALFRQLALVYETLGDFNELGYIGRKRLELRPHDPAATVAAAKSLLFQEKRDAARDLLLDLAQGVGENPAGVTDLVEPGIMLSILELQRDPPDPAAAVAWLDRAVEYDPQSALALAHRAALKFQLSTQDPDRAASLEVAAVGDLTAADALQASDPRALLMLAELWRLHGDPDRAAAALAAAAALTPAQVQAHILDPSDWTASRYQQAVLLAVARDDVGEALALTDQVLSDLAETRRRATLLPLALVAYLAGDRVEEARACLEQYERAITLKELRPPAEAQLALLRAQLAAAEQRPYDVINLLQPFAARPNAPAHLRTLLAAAFEATGQLGRVRALWTDAPPAAAAPGASALLARAQLQAGAWQQALASLPESQPPAAADVETRLLRLAAEAGVALGSPDPAAALAPVREKLAGLQAEHPRHAGIRTLAASLAAARGDLAAAEQELLRAVQECDRPLVAILRLAELYREQDRAAEAVALLEQACEDHADDPRAWSSLAALLRAEDRGADARARLAAGLAQVTDTDAQRDLALQLALLEILDGDAAAGQARAQALAAADPTDVSSRALLLSLPAVQENAELGTQLIAELQGIEGDGGLNWRLHTARRLLAAPGWQRQRDEIEDLLVYCTEADPTWTAPVLLLGDFYERSADLARAESVYRQAFRAGGATELADRLLVLLQRQQRFAEARELLQELSGRLGAPAVAERRLRLTLDEGRFDDALRELELQLSGAGQDPVHLLYLAELRYRQQHDLDGALAALDQAAQRGADPVAVARVRATLFRQAGRESDALAVLNTLVSAHPTADAYLLRAAYHTETGQPDLAEQDYIALASVVNEPRGYAFLGEFYARAGRLDDALLVWEQGLEAFPNSVILQQGLSRGWLTRAAPGDRARAQALLAQMEASSAGDADLLLTRLVERLAEPDAEARSAARALLKQALQAGTAAAGTWRSLAQIALQLAETATARDLIMRGLAQHPRDVSLLLSRAQVEFMLGRPEVAAGVAQQVLGLAPRNPAACELLILAAGQRGDQPPLRDLARDLADWARAEPEVEAARMLLAQARAAAGDLAAARAGLREFCASEAGAGSRPARLMLCEYAVRDNDLADAQVQLDAAAAIDPAHLDVQSARLRVLAVQQRFGELAPLVAAAPEAQQPVLLPLAAQLLAGSPAHRDGAIQLCRQAVAVSPGDPNVHLLLGELLYAGGDVPGAQQAYTQVLRLQPDHADALNNVAWILGEQGADLDTALGYARKAVTLRPADPHFQNTLGYVLIAMPDRPDEARSAFQRSIDLSEVGSGVWVDSACQLARLCTLTNDFTALKPLCADLRKLLASESGVTLAASQRTQLEEVLRQVDSQ